MNYNERQDALADVIDLIEDAAGKLVKMDRDYGLSEAEEYTLARLQEEYTDLCREYDETEKEYINYVY